MASVHFYPTVKGFLVLQARAAELASRGLGPMCFELSDAVDDINRALP